MNKLFFVPALLLVLMHMVSCSDQDTPEDQEKEIPVTFKVSTLNVDVQPMAKSASSGSALEEVVNTIGYYIYNTSDYKLLKSGKVSFIPGVDPVPDNFGQFNERLMPGSYDVIFYALGRGTGSLAFSNIDQLSSGTAINYNNKEIFYYHDNITISSSSNIVEVSLSRKSAMLKIDISDEVTPEVGSVKFTISDGKQWNVYYKRNETIIDYTFDGTITNNKLEPFEYYFSFPNTPTKVIIAIYDKNGSLYGKKELLVPTLENRRTIISGKLFSSLGSQEIFIHVDDIWGEDIGYPLE
ncbi:exported hypothetical protein [uncultured Dysgonomonas sp.]|uniref:Fimbrillin-A associated anchor s Mfa1 and Mfa2 family protein n=1 Tax=uncultured Dysgonomonas sp. TaxID=206096 RepID=A0A212JWP0_9BACT|nr:hypothetical protein [uncultured Dysgonomonas sp.]SBW03886.1 exported hypothetical protein [uncultured Dysgonomonas sp.]